MIRVAHTADWHLGAGPDYAPTPGGRLVDQELVLSELVEACVNRDVDVLVHSGDVFHRRYPPPAEILVAQRILGRLRNAGIEVLIVGGNHDHPGIGVPSAIELFDGLVDVRRSPDLWRGDITVGCLPWTPVAQLVALHGGGDRDETHAHAVALLLQLAQELRDSIDGPALLGLHYSVSGTTTSTGALTDDFREVVLPADALADIGFDAILAGHIHLAQDFIGGSYSGSPMVIDFGEASHEHGFRILELDETGVVSSEFVELHDRPFLTLDFDHEDPVAQIALSQSVGWDVEDAIVRIRIRATEEQARRVDQAAIREALLAAGARKVFSISVEVLREQRARAADMNETLSTPDALAMWGAANAVSEANVTALQDLTAGYLQDGAG